MKYCRYCGTKMNDKFTFCPECGAPIHGIQKSENNKQIRKLKCIVVLSVVGITIIVFGIVGKLLTGKEKNYNEISYASLVGKTNNTARDKFYETIVISVKEYDESAQQASIIVSMPDLQQFYNKNKSMDLSYEEIIGQISNDEQVDRIRTELVVEARINNNTIEWLSTDAIDTWIENELFDFFSYIMTDIDEIHI